MPFSVFPIGRIGYSYPRTVRGLKFLKSHSRFITVLDQFLVLVKSGSSGDLREKPLNQEGFCIDNAELMTGQQGQGKSA